MTELAGHVEIIRTGGVTIDGVELPWHITSAVVVETSADGPVTVTLTLPASSASIRDEVEP